MARRSTGLVAILALLFSFSPTALAAALLEGEIIHGALRRVSIYSASTGLQVASVITDGFSRFAVSLPESHCNDGGGYLLYAEGEEGYQSLWYSLEYPGSLDREGATCISIPGPFISMSLPRGEYLEGYVKDAQTAADLDGAVLYVYDADRGTFVAWTKSGYGGGPGRWRVTLDPARIYKVRAVGGGSYQSIWYDGATSWQEASTTSPPAAVNFSLAPPTTISGFVRDAATGEAIDGAVLYAFEATSGRCEAWAVSGRGEPGRYSLEVTPSGSYKVLVHAGGSYPDVWYDGARNFVEASALTAPTSVDFLLQTAPVVEGYVKDSATAADIPWVPVYAFRAPTGEFAAFAVTGLDGRYSLRLPSEEYKLLSTVDTDHDPLWYDGAWSWTDATAVTPPAVANFSAPRAAVLSGTVEVGGHPAAGVQVAVFPSSRADAIPRWTSTDESGRFSLKVAETASSGRHYRALAVAPDGRRSWLTYPQREFAVRSLLRNALTTEKTYYVDEQRYTDDPFLLRQIESTIHFVTDDPAPGTAEVRVRVADVVGTQDAMVCLSARTGDGSYLGLADVAVGPSAGHYFFASQPVDPFETCDPTSVAGGYRYGWPAPTTRLTTTAFEEAAYSAAPGSSLFVDLDPPPALRSVLRAFQVEQDYFAENGTYLDDTPTLSSLAPELDWTLGPPAPTGVPVRVAVGGSSTSLCLTTLDAEGTYWAIAVFSLFYTLRAASDPLPECTEEAVLDASDLAYPPP